MFACGKNKVKLDTFDIDRIESKVCEIDSKVDIIDAEIENEWIDQTVIRELEQLDPFGSGWEKPVFCFKTSTERL